MIRRIILVVVVSALPVGAAEFRTGQPVMGTLLEVTVVAENTEKARTAATAAVNAVRRWDDILTIWRSDGELARLNQAAGRGPVAISEDLHAALVEMLALTDKTGGAFDPGVGPLVDLWRGTAAAAGKIDPVGGEFAMRSALTLTSGRAALATGAALDAGAIGKGIGLDAAVGVLRAAGIEAAFLNFGDSSQIGIGAPPDSPEGWPVAVSALDARMLRGVVMLRDAALSTSRTRAPEAPEGSLIDPQSRQPVTAARVATVRGGSATDADAWSTALVVLGSAGTARARRQGLDVFFEDGDGAVEQPEFIAVPE